MARYYPGSGSPSFFCLCLDEGGVLAYHKYAAEPLRAAGLAELLLQLDRLMDCLNYPKAAMEERSFIRRRAVPAAEHPTEMRSADELAQLRGLRATYFVYVASRFHASWQGELSFPDRSGSAHFESMLDLCKLIDNGWHGEPEGELR